MNKLKTFSKKLMKNNKGQGMVEYILLLVVVVAIVMVAKQPLMDRANDILSSLQGKIGEVTGN